MLLGSGAGENLTRWEEVNDASLCFPIFFRIGVSMTGQSPCLIVKMILRNAVILGNCQWKMNMTETLTELQIEPRSCMTLLAGTL
jgi:hypothetical protein